MTYYQVFWNDCEGPVFKTVNEACKEAGEIFHYDLEGDAKNFPAKSTVRIEEVEMTKAAFAALPPFGGY